MNVRLYPAVAPLAVGSVRPTERVRLYPAETLSAMAPAGKPPVDLGRCSFLIHNPSSDLSTASGDILALPDSEHGLGHRTGTVVVPQMV
jgi:hypothetical protein